MPSTSYGKKKAKCTPRQANCLKVFTKCILRSFI